MVQGWAQMIARSLYIIKRENGTCVYHKDFGEKLFDPHLLSMLIMAILAIFEEIQSVDQTIARTFEGSDFKALIEFGEWTIGIFLVSHEEEDDRKRLKRIIERFEDQFSVLQWVDMDLAVYSRFERTVMSEFILSQIHPESVIHVIRDWDLYTKNPDLISFLRMIPEKCSLIEASKFLEMPVELVMNLAAEAVWEKVATITQPVRPDDIYQATSLVTGEIEIEEVSEETAEALGQLDGETPLSIAAERVRTKDLRRFLEEITILAKRRAIERISPEQALVVLYSFALQAILNKCVDIFGFGIARKLFYDARETTIKDHSWIVFTTLEEGVDVEIKPSLISAVMQRKISKETLANGFLNLFSQYVKRVRKIIGPSPTRAIIYRSKDELEEHFPTRAYRVEWERLLIGSG